MPEKFRKVAIRNVAKIMGITVFMDYVRISSSGAIKRAVNSRVASRIVYQHRTEYKFANPFFQGMVEGQCMRAEFCCRCRLPRRERSSLSSTSPGRKLALRHGLRRRLGIEAKVRRLYKIITLQLGGITDFVKELADGV